MDGPGLLARHAEVKRTAWVHFPGVQVLFGRHRSTKKIQHRSLCREQGHTCFLDCDSDQPLGTPHCGSGQGCSAGVGLGVVGPGQSGNTVKRPKQRRQRQVHVMKSGVQLHRTCGWLLEMILADGRA